MMASKSRAHIVIGFAGVAAFVVTGAVTHSATAILVFRIAHIYLLSPRC